MIPNIGPMELIIVLVVAVVILGPKRLPEMGSSLGRGLRNFRKGIGGGDSGDDPETPVALPARRGEGVPASTAGTSSPSTRS